MRVATWNINGIRARLGRLTEWLEDRKPDAVCLQELKITDDKFPFEEIAAKGYQAAVSGQAGWNGVAVLAREQPELVIKELDGASEAGSRFIVARAAGIEIASVYIPNGKTLDHPDYQVKVGWLGQLARYIEAMGPKKDFVLGGDFNVCRTAQDSFGGESFAGHIFHTPAERGALERIEGAGLRDVFRAKYPDTPGFTWWDYRAGCFHKNEGMRLDMLFMSAPLAAKVEKVTVDREYRKKNKDTGSVPSDHAPVFADL